MLTPIPAYLLIAVFFIVERRLRQGKEAKSLAAGQFDQGSTKYIAIAFVTSILMLILAPILNSFHIGSWENSSIVGLVGLLISVIGLFLRYWASKTLGAYYTRTLLIKTEHHVVDTGPYRWIRNPGYLGTLMLFIGAGLAVINWIAAIVIVVVTLVAYIYRIRVEEVMLQAELGEPYRQYMTRSWRLIPLVY